MKKNVILCTSSAILSALAVGVLSITGNMEQPSLPGYAVEAESAYSFTMDKGLEMEGDWGTYRKDNGSIFNFYAWDYVPGVSNFGSFTSGGGLSNYTAIHSLKSITITMTSGNVNVYTGWKEGSDDFHYASEIAGYVYGEDSKTIDLSDTLPSYVKLDVTEDAVITSIRFNYDCEPITENSSFTLIADAPTINGDTEDLAAYNYLWVNTNISTNGGVWESFKMNKRGDGKWTYTFTDVAVDTNWERGYKYSLYLGNEDNPNWNCGATSKNIGTLSYEGQTEFYATGDAVTFASQPAKATYDEFKLNVTINITGDIPESFGNIQVVYWNPDTDKTVWNDLESTERKNTYIFETDFEMSTSGSPSFEVYIWDSTIGNINITPVKDGDWYSLTPTKNYAVEYVTVEFAYPTVSGNMAGTFTHQNLSGMVFPSQEVSVIKDKLEINPEFTSAGEEFTSSYSGDNIRIDDDKKITGIKGGTTTKVTLNSKTSSKTSFFFITVSDNRYSENYDAFVIENTTDKAADVEGWWEEHPQNTINGLTRDFWNGVDVSSAYALYQNGAHFYNEDGVEESLFRQLKNAGVNYSRIRLWVKPETGDGVSYGGGHNDLATALWLAKEAKEEGLKVLLDLHYSDFWADPLHQVMPKEWGNITGSMLLAKVTSYTTETLNAFKDAGLTPDMVQLGNEISSGVLKNRLTGEDIINEVAQGEEGPAIGEPSYHYASSSFSSGISDSEFVHAASEGVKAVSSSIKRVVHWTKGGKGDTSSAVNNFFGGFTSSDYDYAALSVYPYNLFNSLSEATALFNGISVGHPWFIAEISYPFSGTSWAGDLTAFKYNNEHIGDKSFANVDGYEFTAAGQANVIHDITSAVVTAGGLGAFYWEPAWIPNANVGWAGVGSRCSWSNQGFFSYDGKAMPNLDLVKSMIPN